MFLRWLCAALLIGANIPQGIALACEPVRQAASLNLAEFESKAEVVMPSGTAKLRGVAVLFAGSDLADMDGTIVDGADQVVAKPLRQIADRLACAGYASIRYNKRYVTGATEVDRARFDTLAGADLAADGRTALAYIRAHPALGGLPVALVGWSEGTTVAMAVAAAEHDVRAVVLLAPIVMSPARTVQAHYVRVGKPYLDQYATDSALDADAIARAGSGPGGVLAQIFVRMFRGFAPGERVNPLLDANSDGRIAFSEADPIIEGWYADTPNGGLGMAATGRALKGVADAFADTTQPLLILQGLNDGNVDPLAARDFARRTETKDRVTLLTYEGLGHSLGPAQSMIGDNLGPMAPAPLADIAQWLDRVMPERR